MVVDRFKTFVLNETRSHLGEKVGDILSSLQNLDNDAANLGNKALITSAEGIVDNIQPVLSAKWPDTELATLQSLQRIGVALKLAIDSNEDLKQIISTAVEDLQQASGESEEPVNDLAATAEAKPESQE